MSVHAKQKGEEIEYFSYDDRGDNRERRRCINKSSFQPYTR